MHATSAASPSPSLSSAMHPAELAIGEARNCSPFAGTGGCGQEKYCYLFAIRRTVTDIGGLGRSTCMA
ncbi:Uncharacterized protein DBV15_05017 [Temnothorax longispinosus]|uniref:Uncharacterized protein n=1 Tax=Temnothorax longispinosus TaxID=300112 RepID=A0A4S2KN88_9HYME|nr:Uncharacterized protein DBV15_05017 [Temnothorax longispinosus]